MKRYLPIYMAILIGIVFGNLIFKSYEVEEVMTSDGNVYLLQYGAYTSKSVMHESIQKIDKDNYSVILMDDVYYVYLGITTNYEVALRIQKFYDQRDIFLYIKENYLGNNQLINEIKEIDKLILEEDADISNYIKQGLSVYRDKNV